MAVASDPVERVAGVGMKLLSRLADWWNGPPAITMTVVCESPVCGEARTITFYDFPETDMQAGGWDIGPQGGWACWEHRDWGRWPR